MLAKPKPPQASSRVVGAVSAVNGELKQHSDDRQNKIGKARSIGQFVARFLKMLTRDLRHGQRGAGPAGEEANHP